MARGRGRPPLPIEVRYVQQTIKLPPDIADIICRMALARDMTVYGFLQRTLERVFGRYKNQPDPVRAYREQQSSTLSAMLSESPSVRADRIAEPSSPR